METCYFCGSIFGENDLAVQIGDDFVCLDCLDKVTRCDHCGEAIPPSEQDGAFFTHDNFTLCETCYCQHTIECAECGAIIMENNAHQYHDSLYCSTCYEEHFGDCRDCGHTHPIDELDGDGLCPNCAHPIVHDYGYKPHPKFKGEGLHLGMELEIDDGSGDTDDAERLLDILDERSEEHVYCKHDGSLDDGFEFVFHPHTLEEYKKLPIEEFCAQAVHMGYSSHYSRRCGLHVHVGRRQLCTSRFSENEVIGRLLYFFQENWKEMCRFSRRCQSQINDWCDRYAHAATPNECYNVAVRDCERYRAINLRNSETIEFRIFNGSLNPNTIIATLQFVAHLVWLCQSSRREDELTWDEFWVTLPEDYKALKKYLDQRRLIPLTPNEDDEK